MSAHAPASPRVDVAVFGPDSVEGQAVLAALAEARLPIGQVHALARDGREGRLVDFGDDHLAVRAVDGFDYSSVAVVFLCQPVGLAGGDREQLTQAGVRLIDCCGALDGVPGISLAVAELAGEARKGLGSAAGVACPTGLAAVLGLVLAPLQAHFGLTRVRVATYEAVGGGGPSGVQALDREVRELLNFRTPETQHFGRTLAFNVLPITESGGRDVATELRELLGVPSLGVELVRARVPVFFGDSMAVFAEVDRSASEAELRRALAQAPGLAVSPQGVAPPTPLTEAAVGEEIYVALAPSDVEPTRGVALWVVADTLRRGLGLNAVRVAELLLKEYL